MTLSNCDSIQSTIQAQTRQNFSLESKICVQSSSIDRGAFDSYGERKSVFFKYVALGYLLIFQKRPTVKSIWPTHIRIHEEKQRGENSKLSDNVRNIFYPPNLTDRRSDGGMRVVIA